MQAIVGPACSLMSRLSFGRKIVLVILLFALTLGFSLHALTAQTQRLTSLTAQLAGAGGSGLSDEAMRLRLAKEMRALLESAHEEERGALWVGGAASLALLYLLAGLHFGTVRALGLLSGAARRITEGDLTTRVDIPSRDEIAVVGESINDMARHFAQLTDGVTGTAEELSNTASELSSAVEQVAAAARHQRDTTFTTAATIEQLTVSIDEIAQNLRNSETISQRASELASEGEKIVQESVRGMQKLALTVEQSSQRVTALGSRSDEIGNIIRAIREIADQTNLLALNAAIEAARAGESGRGFSVVADEVRKLAERTRCATVEIGQMIDSVREEIGSAVVCMGESSAEVTHGVQLAGQAAQSLANIQEGAVATLEHIRDMTLAAREQSAGANAIAADVEAIAQMAERNTATVQETSGVVRYLEGLSVKLADRVHKFNF